VWFGVGRLADLGGCLVVIPHQLNPQALKTLINPEPLRKPYTLKPLTLNPQALKSLNPHRWASASWRST